MRCRCASWVLQLVLPCLSFAAGQDWERLALHSAAMDGMSGLDSDGGGGFWGVLEHAGQVFHVQLREHALLLDGPARPVRGFDASLDLESLALIDPATLALGTEGQEADRPADTIYLAHIGEAEITVTETISFPYKPWGTGAGKNHGIEGLCSAGGRLVAASEAVVEVGGQRVAPLGVLDLASRRWTAFRLPLTSDRGRIASLACRPLNDKALEVLAIERQFGVMRLLRFELPLSEASGALASVRPSIVLDVTRLIAKPPNFEGIAWMEDGRVLLISDNDHGGVTGPTEALLWKPAP